MNEDPLRQLLERTLATARKTQSDTGFVATGDKILLYDNFLFCLALFRSKMHEHVLEAKKLLDHLLYFQQTFQQVGSFGNFPLVLSDFPFCYDHLQALRILYVQLWIQREFAAVLGIDLKARLETSIKQAKAFLERIQNEVNLPYWASLKLKAAFGEAVDLSTCNDIRTWGDPVALAELLTAYQLAPQLGNWQPFWKQLAASWHVPSEAFVGPAYKLGSQNGFLNTALALFSKSRANVQNPPLKCALLQPTHAFCALSVPRTLQGESERFSWQVTQEEGFAYSHLVGQESLEKMPGLFPFYLVSKGQTLGMQAPYGYAKDKFIFEIPETVFTDDKERSRVLCIWFDDVPETEVLVDGVKATCFSIQDPLTIRLGGVSLQVKLSIKEGDAELVGHISRANRSGLSAPRFGTPGFSASDVQVLLRAIRGTKPFTLEVAVSLENKS